MKKIKKNVWLLLMCTMILILFAGCSPTGNQEQTSPDKNATEVAVVNMAENWYQENYEKFYDLRNLKGELANVTEGEADGETQYTVKLSSEMMYKFDTIYELPFVKGLAAAGKERDLTSEEEEKVQGYIKEIEEDAQLGEYVESNVDVVISVKDEKDKNSWKLYFSTDEGLADIEELALDEKALYKAGYEFLDYVLEYYR